MAVVVTTKDVCGKLCILKCIRYYYFEKRYCDVYFSWYFFVIIKNYINMNVVTVHYTVYT